MRRARAVAGGARRWPIVFGALVAFGALGAVAAVGAVGALIAGAGGCSINHRSDDFSCEAHPCAENRVCVDGFCVVADSPPGDAAVCPAACTSCNDATRTCTIDCGQSGGCTGAVACPAGWNCSILCSTASSCRNGIRCPTDMACEITCSGAQSCQGITCGAGPCRVACTGTRSCRDVRCGSSCACDVACQGATTCNNLSCEQGCAMPFACSSALPGCNTCQ